MQQIRDLLQNRQVGILDDLNNKRSAVMLPLIEHQGQLCIVFEVRSHQLRKQPGEICFPGGRIEAKDENPRATAIRETSEELGIEPANIVVLGDLDVLVTPFHLFLYSVVGYIDKDAILKPQQEEVAEVFFVPLDYLLKTEPTISSTKVQVSPIEDFPIHLLPNGKDYNWQNGSYPVYFYSYDKYIIWGLTARILYHFLQIIKGATSNE